MWFWPSAVGYALAFLVATRLIYVREDEESPAATDNKAWAVGLGFLWPLELLYRLGELVWWLMNATLFRETPRQRNERVQEEAANLNAEAGKLGLPMPQESVMTQELMPHEDADIDRLCGCGCGTTIRRGEVISERQIRRATTHYRLWDA